MSTLSRAFTLLLASALLSALVAGCGGGSSGGGAAPAEGQIQILNNDPEFIDRIEVAPAGNTDPQDDRLGGVLLSGSGFTVAVPAGLYDVSVFVHAGGGISVRRVYPDIAVGPGALATIIVTP